MNTKSYILNQFQTYPQLELQDLMKFLYQSSFGCEHLLSNPDTVKKQIQQELDTKLDTCNSIEYLDGNYVRLHLNYGLSLNTLSTLFILSSQQEKRQRTARRKASNPYRYDFQSRTSIFFKQR